MLRYAVLRRACISSMQVYQVVVGIGDGSISSSSSLSSCIPKYHKGNPMEYYVVGTGQKKRNSLQLGRRKELEVSST